MGVARAGMGFPALDGRGYLAQRTAFAGQLADMKLFGLDVGSSLSCTGFVCALAAWEAIRAAKACPCGTPALMPSLPLHVAGGLAI